MAPATVPGAPTVTLTPGNGVIAVGVTVADNGGSPVTGIDYSLNGGPFVSTGTTGSSFTIPGLANGTSYTVSVRADNAIGPGTPSAPADATPLTVPGRPGRRHGRRATPSPPTSPGPPRLRRWLAHHGLHRHRLHLVRRDHDRRHRLHHDHVGVHASPG